jgi:hypothetical protein
MLEDKDTIEVVMDAPKQAPMQAPMPDMGKIATGLSLKIDVDLKSLSEKPNYQGLASIWEDLAEDFASLLEKKFNLKEGLSVKSTSQNSTTGRYILTLSMAKDA